MHPRQAFQRVYGQNRNIVTPRVIRYGTIHGSYFYELSTGSGIFGDRIYGVTILRLTADGELEKQHDLNQCVHSETEAETYIKQLRETL